MPSCEFGPGRDRTAHPGTHLSVSPLDGLKELFENNRAWVRRITANQPDFFSQLAAQQSPRYLWIGCSDSRVPANEIVGLLPGELFVHRNVANLVTHSDLNCLSVIQYAVDVLRVEHIIVTGHYGCGGIQAVMDGAKLGLIDNWLRHVQDTRTKHHVRLSAIADKSKQHARLCELNVIEQVRNVCETTIVSDAWARGQVVTVHGVIYALEDGKLRDLQMSVNSLEELETRYELAIHHT
jgi:carbonic anhydrase